MATVNGYHQQKQVVATSNTHQHLKTMNGVQCSLYDVRYTLHGHSHITQEHAIHLHPLHRRPECIFMFRFVRLFIVVEVFFPLFPSFSLSLFPLAFIHLFTHHITLTANGKYDLLIFVSFDFSHHVFLPLSLPILIILFCWNSPRRIGNMKRTTANTNEHDRELGTVECKNEFEKRLEQWHWDDRDLSLPLATLLNDTKEKCWNVISLFHDGNTQNGWNLGETSFRSAGIVFSSNHCDDHCSAYDMSEFSIVYSLRPVID